jgi:hypothetical protein
MALLPAGSTMHNKDINIEIVLKPHLSPNECGVHLSRTENAPSYRKIV